MPEILSLLQNFFPAGLVRLQEFFRFFPVAGVRLKGVLDLFRLVVIRIALQDAGDHRAGSFLVPGGGEDPGPTEKCPNILRLEGGGYSVLPLG